VTRREHRLEAPHRRLESSSRLLERAAVVGYRVTSAVLAHVPPRLSRWVIATASQIGYLVWPTKRRFSNINFGHVLGLPPEDPQVRRLALRAYREYARYVVELMRLPSESAEQLAGAVETAGIDELEAMWRESGGPIIVVAGHVGNNEAIAAGLAERGFPISVVADDSAFPELFEILRRQRESWGVKVVPWRNLRGLFSVLRNNEILALLVDWGYRPDGIPVRLFGAWTTLPAGPATLAAKTGALLAPLAIRRTPAGKFRIETHPPIRVASTDPAELQRATQAIADALEATVAAAPEQWYSFKPCWPATEDEARELEARAAAMIAGPAAPTARPRTTAGTEGTTVGQTARAAPTAPAAPGVGFAKGRGVVEGE
jgi:phosphatidylinositol dimannoside acyltransferase